MNLKIITPLEVYDVSNVDKIYAEGLEGYFTILPKHADYVSSLATSVFKFVSGGKESVFAVDGGVFVKVGSDVSLAVRHIIKGDDLVDLKNKMEKEFYEIDDNERKTRTALASLEGNIAKLLLELGGEV
ncbi:F0F1 ATP synthase subunit epsilon [bacterium]|nr:F0F1 ATP synthase subunit epsilon [bacterium]MDE6224075.1 F0F1 ATP synthase subunit epsilon [Alphaproteobacteria bacterium]